MKETQTLSKDCKFTAQKLPLKATGNCTGEQYCGSDRLVQEVTGLSRISSAPPEKCWCGALRITKLVSFHTPSNSLIINHFNKRYLIF
jgi:hypothetical protein